MFKYKYSGQKTNILPLCPKERLFDMNRKRCVVTGLGLICATGNNVDENIKNIFGGVSGINKVKTFSTENCYANLGAEVALSNSEISPENYDRATLLCIKAASEAISDARLDFSDAGEREKTGVIVGDCVAGVCSIDKFYTAEATCEGSGESDDINKMTATAIANNVALHFGLGGITANIVNACAAGTISISMACDEICAGRAEIFLAGGTDSFSSLAFGGFHALHALSEAPCSPFNHSTGITLGEGAGILVVESYEHAIKRGAHIYCDILGAGISSDAHHITAPRPDGEGQMNAIKKALKKSGLDPEDIDYINAHGTGTAKNDEAEFLSLHTIFDNSNKLSVSSTKAMTGHCLGAAGAIEAVISVLSLTRNEVPPTIGYTAEDLEVLKTRAGQIDFVPNKTKKKEIDFVMSNSFAFGGNNASIIFSKKEHALSCENEAGHIYVSGIGRLMSEKSDSPLCRVNIGCSEFSELGIKMAFYRKLDRFSQLLLLSGVKALRDAGLSPVDDDATEYGMVVGTSDGPLTEIAEFQKAIVQKGASGGNAFSFPNTVYNAAGGYLSIFTGIKGYNVTIANAAQAGIQSICNACDILKNSEEKIMLASGVDENTHITEQLYSRRGLLKSTVPYSSEDNMFAVGEGAVSIVLSSEKKEKTYAEIVGWSSTHESIELDINSTHSKKFTDTLKKAIQSAVDMASIKLSDIDFISGFGNGNSCVDSMELNCYKELFGDMPAIYCTREKTGDARAASCTDQVALAACILSDDKNMYISKPVIGSHEKAEYALCTGFGIGGSFTAVVLKKV